MTFSKITKHVSFLVVGVISAGSGVILSTPSEAHPLPSSFYDVCILRPVRVPFGNYKVKGVDGIRYDDAFFPSSNGKMLHGWLFTQPNAKTTVLVSHGIGGNISSRVDLIHLFLQAGVSVFIYDYQGYGRSEGTASLRNVIQDGQAAYTYLTDNRGIDPSNIVLAGESLGTGVTCGLSKRVKSAGLILQSPFSSLSQRCAEVIPFLRSHPTWLEPTDGLENDSTLRASHPPLLIVHGDEDRTVPVSHAFTLYNEAVGQKDLLVVHGAGHTGDPALMASPEYLLAVESFLRKLESNATLAVRPKTNAPGIPVTY